MADETHKPMTQQEFDRAMAEIRLKKERLELEMMEDDVATKKMNKEQRLARGKRNGKDLRAIADLGQAMAGRCNHKKGGKGLEGFRGNGNDQNYSVFKFQLPTGIIAVFCSRCPKVWLPPVPIKRKDFENPRDYDLARREYAKAKAEYDWAIALPTDNEMATAGLFTGYTKDGTPFQEAGLIEHHKSAAVPLAE